MTPWQTAWAIDVWQRQIEDLFTSSSLFDRELGSLPQWQIELTDTDSALVLTVELPGISAHDIGVQVDSNRVVLSAYQRQAQINRYGQILGYGQLQQAIALPCSIVRDRVRSVIRGNQLILSLPKATAIFQAESPKRIQPIQQEPVLPTWVDTQANKLDTTWQQAKRWLGQKLQHLGDRLLKSSNQH